MKWLSRSFFSLVLQLSTADFIKTSEKELGYPISHVIKIPYSLKSCKVFVYESKYDMLNDNWLYYSMQVQMCVFDELTTNWCYTPITNATNI